MTALLDHANSSGALKGLPISSASSVFLGETGVMPMTCTPATAAIATTFKVIDAAGDNPGPGIETAGDPTDPANNQVNY